jgi:phosphorylase kinase alpha/beta subunit
LIIHQSPTTGLFPVYSNSKQNSIGLIKDTIYCSMTVWSLRQCYTKVDSDKGRTYHLGQIAVKSMRGILFCWMRQGHKLEKFKLNPSPENALHSKFNIITGDELQDENYGHLQIDCVSLYLVALAQMTTSGLQVCLTFMIFLKDSFLYILLKLDHLLNR